MGEALGRTAEILDTVGLAPRAAAPITALTIADLKRLELARALAMDPQLLLLDEVMAGLSPREVETTMRLVEAVNRRGTTIVMIEHVMKAIMGISHRILVLHHGRRIALGRPAEVAGDPAVIEAYLGHRYAARSGAGG
jgi:branched-chain amino acid transport system ATP-binding protein